MISQRELDHARVARGGNLAERPGGGNRGPGIAEIHPVEQVEELAPELEFMTFQDAKRLEHAEVHRGAAGSAQNISSGRSECAQCWQRESGRIEVLVDEHASRTAGGEKR